MDALAFKTWLFDPIRNREELFCAEILIEFAEEQLPRVKAQPFSTRYDAAQEKRRRRSLDPGYQPRISQKRFDEAEPFFPSLNRFTPDSGYNDRRLADLSALRFFPRIDTVNACTQLRDLSGLLPLSSLKHLSISDQWLRDVSALKSLPNLEHLSLTLRHPWPAPNGLESLAACTVIHLHLNLQVVEGIPSWPQVKQVRLTTTEAPLRDLLRLPEMPVVKELEIDAAALEGLERYATLEKLKLHGVFEDLAPLAGLTRLRELTLAGERFENLSPLANLPELRVLVLERERGLLLDPLLEAPRLRTVKAPQCKVIATELASLNTAIAWQREDFTVDPPPTLPPLRTMRYEQMHPETKAAHAVPRPDERELFAPGEATFIETEKAWIISLLKKTLKEQRGTGWGGINSFGAGKLYVAFFRKRELHAVWSVLELIRSILVVARFHWEVIVVFDEEEANDWWSSDDDDDDDGVYVSSEEEIEDARQRARDRRAFLEREHQLRLGAQGLPVKPSEAESARAEPSVPPPESAEQEADADDAEESAYVPLDTLRLTLTKDIAWVDSSWEDDARIILDRELEDWHALPGPPEARPTPP
jgi:hypothetical protein